MARGGGRPSDGGRAARPLVVDQTPDAASSRGSFRAPGRRPADDTPRRAHRSVTIRRWTASIGWPTDQTASAPRTRHRPPIWPGTTTQHAARDLVRIDDEWRSAHDREPALPVSPRRAVTSCTRPRASADRMPCHRAPRSLRRSHPGPAPAVGDEPLALGRRLAGHQVDPGQDDRATPATGATALSRGTPPPEELTSRRRAVLPTQQVRGGSGLSGLGHGCILASAAAYSQSGATCLGTTENRDFAPVDTSRVQWRWGQEPGGSTGAGRSIVTGTRRRVQVSSYRLVSK